MANFIKKFFDVDYLAESIFWLILIGVIIICQGY